MTMKFTLKSGMYFTNQELMDTFGVASRGGMRRSLKNNVLLLIHNTIDSIYKDRWEGDVFYYTGMGLTGNQSVDFHQNKTLANSGTNGVPVLLFEKNKENRYQYVAEVCLAGKPFYEIQKDDNDNMRQVVVFPLSVKK